MEPNPSARLDCRVFVRGGALSGAALTDTRRVPPDSFVSIGDRALLGLELAESPLADTDLMGLLGQSKAICAVRAEVRALANFSGSVCLTGPTGAGKERVARALHARSTRAGKPFGRVNCSTLHGELLESTLFGHRKGAFTGAVSAEPGMFVESDGGTLLLDEWTELSPAAQPRLLRALEEREVRAVGATRPRPVDVRVIGATNRDPEADVAAGRLRPDLYHRLATHLVAVPSLAERQLDIPELFVAHLGTLREAHPEISWLWSPQPRRPLGVELDLMLDLMRHPWTGNVRELQNTAERLAVQAQQPRRVLAMPAAPRTSPPPSARTSPRPAELGPMPEALGPAAAALSVVRRVAEQLLDPEALALLQPGSPGFAAAVRELAARALAARLEVAAFNQTATAAELGLARNTLSRLVRLLKLPTANDLTLTDIDAAIGEANGDQAAAARTLRVSYRALVRRRSALARRNEGQSTG